MNRNGDSTPSMDFDELLRRHQAFKERQSRERAAAPQPKPSRAEPAPRPASPGEKPEDAAPVNGKPDSHEAFEPVEPREEEAGVDAAAPSDEGFAAEETVDGPAEARSNAQAPEEAGDAPPQLSVTHSAAPSLRLGH